MLLILGGTTEASALARLVAARPGLSAQISLAGRTLNPAPLPLPTRIGGFGGVEGLCTFIRLHRVSALIDATHPFARRMSANAAAAACLTGVPFMTLRRQPWSRQPGDLWTEVADSAAARNLLGAEPKRVFLTVGRLELEPFLAAPQHFYLIRTVDAPDQLPPDARLILDRGPFDEAAEAALLRAERIDCLITKNSGGTATYGKIAAARALGLPVLLLNPPPEPEPHVETAAAAMAWLDALSHPAHGAVQPRGE